MAERARLSDQALVVLTLARQGSAGRSTVAHLLAAAAAEPEGAAGMVLRERQSAAGALQERLGAAPAALASAEAALARAVASAGPRPVDTVDLVTAALEVGDAELADLLQACGYDLQALTRELAAAADDRSDPQRQRETRGFPPEGQHPGLTPAAIRVVAKVRAVAGGAVDVVLGLAAAEDEPVFSAAEAEAVLAAVWRLRKRGEDRAPGWDEGLEAVVAAADVVRAGGRATCADLLRAALLAGGRGPARLLEEAQAGLDLGR